MHIIGWAVLGCLVYRLLLAVVGVGVILAIKLAKAIKAKIEELGVRYSAAIATVTVEMLRESSLRGDVRTME